MSGGGVVQCLGPRGPLFLSWCREYFHCLLYFNKAEKRLHQRIERTEAMRIRRVTYSASFLKLIMSSGITFFKSASDTKRVSKL